MSSALDVPPSSHVEMARPQLPEPAVHAPHRADRRRLRLLAPLLDRVSGCRGRSWLPSLPVFRSLRRVAPVVVLLLLLGATPALADDTQGYIIRAASAA